MFTYMYVVLGSLKSVELDVLCVVSLYSTTRGGRAGQQSGAPKPCTCRYLLEVITVVMVVFVLSGSTYLALFIVISGSCSV